MIRILPAVTDGSVTETVSIWPAFIVVHQRVFPASTSSGVAAFMTVGIARRAHNQECTISLLSHCHNVFGD